MRQRSLLRIPLHTLQPLAGSSEVSAGTQGLSVLLQFAAVVGAAAANGGCCNATHALDLFLPR